MADPTTMPQTIASRHRINLEIQVLQAENEIRVVQAEKDFGNEYVRICEREVQKAAAALEKSKSTTNTEAAKAKHIQAERELAAAKESRPAAKARHVAHLKSELKQLEFMLMGYDKNHGFTTKDQEDIRAAAVKLLQAEMATDDKPQQKNRTSKASRIPEDGTSRKKSKKTWVIAPKQATLSKRSPGDKGARLRKAHDEKMANLRARKTHASTTLGQDVSQKADMPKEVVNKSQQARQLTQGKVSSAKTALAERAGTTSAGRSSSEDTYGHDPDSGKLSRGKKRVFTSDDLTDGEVPLTKRSKSTATRSVRKKPEQPATAGSSRDVSIAPTYVREKLIVCKTGT